MPLGEVRESTVNEPVSLPVVLVFATGARMSVNIAKPGLFVRYRTPRVDVLFELHCIDSSLRLVYRQTEDR